MLPSSDEVSPALLLHPRKLNCREFDTNSVMSSHAIVHLAKLSNLLDWTTGQVPPRATDLIPHGVPDNATSLFPSLKVFRLDNSKHVEHIKPIPYLARLFHRMELVYSPVWRSPSYQGSGRLLANLPSDPHAVG